MRRGDNQAFEEFFRRFHSSLVDEARRLGVQPALRIEAATDCLHDAIMALTHVTKAPPTSLAGYLVVSLRHDVMNGRRDQRTRMSRNERAVRETPITNESVVSETYSEGSLRASYGPEVEEINLAPPLERLASALDEGLTEEERHLLACLGQWVPQRLIAEWLGITYGALRVRVLRLRARLREAAMKYAGNLDDEEQRVLNRFFRRTMTATVDQDKDDTPDRRRSRHRPTAGRREPRDGDST
jgi:RNA polymerase sigma factor (sigma-70 family)